MQNDRILEQQIERLGKYQESLNPILTNPDWEDAVARAIIRWIGVTLSEQYQSIESTVDNQPVFAAIDFIKVMIRTAPDVVGRCLQAGASVYLDEHV